MARGRRPLRNKILASIGIAWVSFVLVKALLRLTPLAFAPWFDGSMTDPQKVLWVGWFVVNAYFEGYKGFQQRFSPRVVGRAAYLGDNPTPLRVLFALPFCMSLFHANRRQLVFRWAFITALYTLIALVRYLPQPWRGILDGGVIIGLAWGLVAMWVHFGAYLLDRPHPVATDLPETERDSVPDELPGEPAAG